MAPLCKRALKAGQQRAHLVRYRHLIPHCSGHRRIDGDALVFSSPAQRAGTIVEIVPDIVARTWRPRRRSSSWASPKPLAAAKSPSWTTPLSRRIRQRYDRPFSPLRRLAQCVMSATPDMSAGTYTRCTQGAAMSARIADVHGLRLLARIPLTSARPFGSRITACRKLPIGGFCNASVEAVRMWSGRAAKSRYPCNPQGMAWKVPSRVPTAWRPRSRSTTSFSTFAPPAYFRAGPGSAGDMVCGKDTRVPILRRNGGYAPHESPWTLAAAKRRGWPATGERR